MNELCLQRGRGLKVNGYIFKHPTLGEIADFEEDCNSDTYMLLLFSIIMTSKDLADVLWVENKVWYEDIKSEWSFFIQRLFVESEQCIIKIEWDNTLKEIPGLSVGLSTQKILNFFLQTEGKWVFLEKNNEEEDQSEGKDEKDNINQIMLVNINTDNICNDDSAKFTEYHYNLLVEYIKKTHWIKPEYDFLKGGSRSAKEWILKHNYKQRKREKRPDITLSSINSSIIAKGVNSSTWNLPVYMIFDLYYRHIKIDEYKNTMSALYAGAIDTKENPIDWEKINWSNCIL